jgi:hypothetical protein
MHRKSGWRTAVLNGDRTEVGRSYCTSWIDGGESEGGSGQEIDGRTHTTRCTVVGRASTTSPCWVSCTCGGLRWRRGADAEWGQARASRPGGRGRGRWKPKLDGGVAITRATG